MTVYDKINEFKDKLKDNIISNISDNELLKCCQKLANKWQYQKLGDRRKVELTDNELLVHNALVQHGYKPTTVYKWLLLTKTNDPGLVQKLRNGRVSQKNAFKLKRQSPYIHKLTDGDLRVAIEELIDRYIEQ